MTGMWSNVQESGMMHHVHQHPNSFLSGVLYISIPECENPGRIHFTDPRQAKNMVYADFKKESCISSRTIWIKPTTGTLLLFPSWLEHGTEHFISNNKDDIRVSLSFNYRLTSCSYETMKI
jgi:uncharacterized protein (TIGR02466 family)